MSRLIALLTACLLALVLASCGGDDGGDETAATATPTAEATAEETPAGADEFLPEGCENVEKPAPKEDGTLEEPKEELDKAKTYVATVSTTCGDFEITLDAERAPITGGSFKYLADEKFFDGLTFHRIVADFVIQGGDPLGAGTGGSGYSVVEEPPSDLKYTKGIVAMAKTADEAPGTSGSQFFVVTGAGAEQLPPEYALVGEVTKGMEVAEKIGSIPAGPDGAPAAAVVINSVTVSES
ncbi:peptidylprolyl isomerase [Solirubrobacter sp. CPCC 204708]|uniref:Peptidyl-prolyl cis-trans isomerase n=1 Tax=Solirubrobacter deserti TaxID=2282478 RepID=A0ABT4RHG7_9ACTN|nr:peptidylprolyl isomerase [Solirubrobacter deserti]MBE2315288.1 peptidylprolyl isomerase [Solirubrobacter deserti]MDA0137973.1 peptidylprolyl isomerase [Solirubrobacter deserti]